MVDNFLLLATFGYDNFDSKKAFIFLFFNHKDYLHS